MLSLAWISLAALVVVIVLSCTSAVNPGFLSLALAWVIGVYVAPGFGQRFTIGEVLAGFPTDLFITLVGVTLLFTLARGNGTLDRVVRAAVRGCRGNAGLIPILFFGLSCGIASIGAGNIATAALIAPLAMAVAERANIPPFLMTVMVAHGCVAGALSPIAPTGIIASGLMARMGMSGLERQNYLSNLAANAAAAALGYLAFGGWRLFGRRYEEAAADTDGGEPGLARREGLAIAGRHAGGDRGPGRRRRRVRRPRRDGGLRRGRGPHPVQGRRRAAGDRGLALERDRDGLRRDRARPRCWRRPAGSSRSRP